jgi:cobalt-zinc-cadmium efflux system membrane fusion protein
MPPAQQHTVGLRTATAAVRPITEDVTAPGTIAFEPGHVAIIRPLAPARVVRLLVAPGDTVRAGQAVARVEIPSLISQEQELASAKANMRQAGDAASVARAAWQRGVVLAREGSMARAETDQRRLVLAQAEAALSVARYRVTALQSQVDRLHPSGGPGRALLVTPLAGVVASADVTPGESIDTTTNSFMVADLSVVMADAEIPEASATLVQVGDQATVHLTAGGGADWNGEIDSLGAALDPQARTLPARITLRNPGQTLRAGMFVSVTITARLGRDGVTIPAEAVQFVGSRQVAFTPAGDNRFQAHDLTLGVRQPAWVEVRKGLKPGEPVVTAGSFALKSLLQEAMNGGGG